MVEVPRTIVSNSPICYFEASFLDVNEEDCLGPRVAASVVGILREFLSTRNLCELDFLHCDIVSHMIIDALES